MGIYSEAADVVIPSPPPSGPAPLSPPLPPPPSPYRVSLSCMVVPDVPPPSVPCKVVPPRRLLFMNFTGRTGVKRRHLVKAPLLNDLHVASLHTDKRRAEAALAEVRKELRDVKAMHVREMSSRHIEARDVNKAYEVLSDFPEYALERDQFAQLQVRIGHLQNDLQVSQKRAAVEIAAKAKAVQASRGYKLATVSAQQSVRELTDRLSSAIRRADAAGGRAAHALATVSEMSKAAREMQGVLNATAENVGQLEANAAWGEATVPELELKLADAKSRILEAEAQLHAVEIAFIAEQEKTAPKRGRPVGHKGADLVCALWDTYTPTARRSAFHRHCKDIRAGLMEGGIQNWLPSALAVVLDSLPSGTGSWVDQLFSSRPFCERKNEFAADLRAVANAEWGVDMAGFFLVDVGLSRRMYQKLRNGWNRSIWTPQNSTSSDPRAGMYSPRPWYTCPVTGCVINLPEPLPPLYKTVKVLTDYLEPMGLTLSEDGSISERSFLATLRETFRRDASVLKVFDVRRPAHPCFGIDHATISGARDFTQGGITMGGCYSGGSLLSEQKHVTLVVGRHHDDGSGLALMLGPKPGVVGIAEEFRQLSDSGNLDMGGGGVHHLQACNLPRLCSIQGDYPEAWEVFSNLCMSRVGFSSVLPRARWHPRPTIR